MMYPLIRIPTFANKSFYDFTKAEAKEYLQWFLSIKNERISTLESHVKQSYDTWEANYTKESLKDLYQWFSKTVAYRERTTDEKKEVENQISLTPEYINVIPIPETIFTEETVSICFDAGLYFGETLIFNIPSLKWLQKLNSKNFIDFAQPLIGKKESKVPINPRRIAESIAQRILDKDTPITFEMLYEKWVDKFSHSLPPA